MTIGKVKIDQLEYERVDTESTDEDATVQEFHDNKPLYPAVTDQDFNDIPGDSFVDWEQIGKDGYTSEIWNPDQLSNANGLFGSSPALVGGAGSTVSSIGSNSAIYARVDGGADAPGLLTHINDKPVANP